MTSNRRTFLRSGIIAASASVLVGLQGCGLKSKGRLIGGYQKPDGSYGISAINTDGDLLWDIPTQTRVHGLSIHPHQAIGAIAARRPGSYIILFDPDSGTKLQELACPSDYFLEGHLEFTEEQLWSTAAQKSSSQGALLCWNLNDYRTSPEIRPLPGLGPHQVIRGETGQLWVALGGWQTRDREVLNSQSFKSSLLGYDFKNETFHQAGNPEDSLSIRHLAYNNGDLFAAMQYPDPHPSSEALIYKYSNQGWTALKAPHLGWQGFKGYIASLAANDQLLVATSPQGHRLGVWDRNSLEPLVNEKMLDVAGATNLDDQLYVSSGTGLTANPVRPSGKKRTGIHWDNHWISYTPA